MKQEEIKRLEALIEKEEEQIHSYARTFSMGRV